MRKCCRTCRFLKNSHLRRLLPFFFLIANRICFSWDIFLLIWFLYNIFFCCSGNQILGWHNRPPSNYVKHSTICLISSQDDPIDVNHKITKFTAIYKISHLQHRSGWSLVLETMLKQWCQHMKYRQHGVSLRCLEVAHLLPWAWGALSSHSEPNVKRQ